MPICPESSPPSAPRVSILGICAGHQLIGRAHGAAGRRLGALQPVEIDPRSPLFRGLPTRPRFFQSHYWQLEEIPAGVVLRAHSPWSTTQAIERRDRPVFGVQFHPEGYEPTHSVGASVLQNFFALAHVHQRTPAPVPRS